MDEIGDIAILHAQLADAQANAQLWLTAAESNEERVYVRRMQDRIDDLQRILDRIEIRRIKLCDAPEERRRCEESIKAFLDAFQRARESRGSIVGKHLNALSARLSNRPEWMKWGSADMHGEQPQREPTSSVEQATVNGAKRKPEDHRAMVNTYIAEVLDKTGKRITRKDIWRKAGYKSRTEFERWERQDAARPNRAAAEAFNRILREKPHLK
jgi:hypothetical protein